MDLDITIFHGLQVLLPHLFVYANINPVIFQTLLSRLHGHNDFVLSKGTFESKNISFVIPLDVFFTHLGSE